MSSMLRDALAVGSSTYDSPSTGPAAPSVPARTPIDRAGQQAHTWRVGRFDIERALAMLAARHDLVLPSLLALVECGKYQHFAFKKKSRTTLWILF